MLPVIKAKQASQVFISQIILHENSSYEQEIETFHNG